VVRAAAMKGRTLRNPHAYGVLEAQGPGQQAFRLDVSLDFPQVPCLSKENLYRTGLDPNTAQHIVSQWKSAQSRCAASSAR